MMHPLPHPTAVQTAPGMVSDMPAPDREGEPIVKWEVGRGVHTELTGLAMFPNDWGSTDYYYHYHYHNIMIESETLNNHIKHTPPG